MNKLLIGAAVIAVVLLAYWYSTAFEANTNVIYYSSPTCPHCINFEPVWQEFAAYLRRLNIPAQKIVCKSGECPVAGFPTVICKHKDKTYTFPTADRSVSALVVWIQNIVRYR